MDELYTAILNNTYSREAALRRVSLLRQAVETALYDQSVTDQVAAYEAALAVEVPDMADQQAIAAWGTAWLAAVSGSGVHEFLETLRAKLLATTQRVVYVPVLLSSQGEQMVGAWCRQTLGIPELFIDYELDTSLIAGCGIVIDGQYYDYSFSAQLAARPNLVRDILNTYAAPHTATK